MISWAGCRRSPGMPCPADEQRRQDAPDTPTSAGHSSIHHPGPCAVMHAHAKQRASRGHCRQEAPAREAHARRACTQAQCPRPGPAAVRNGATGMRMPLAPADFRGLAPARGAAHRAHVHGTPVVAYISPDISPDTHAGRRPPRRGRRKITLLIQPPRADEDNPAGWPQVHPPHDEAGPTQAWG